MRLLKYEQETIINFNEEEKTADVYTHNKALCRKLEKSAVDRPEDCRFVRSLHEGQAAEYTIPKSWVKITPKHIITEEQRAILQERARRVFSAQKAR